MESLDVPLHFIEQMSSVLEAPEDSAWFDAVSQLASSWGFGQVMLAILPRPGMRLEDAFIRTNYSSAWRQSYNDHNMAYFDPTVAHCTTRSSPLIWSPELFATEQQQTMYEEARSHGLRQVLPCRSMARARRRACCAS